MSDRRQTLDVIQHHRLMPPGRGIIIKSIHYCYYNYYHYYYYYYYYCYYSVGERHLRCINRWKPIGNIDHYIFHHNPASYAHAVHWPSVYLHLYAFCQLRLLSLSLSLSDQLLLLCNTAAYSCCWCGGQRRRLAVAMRMLNAVVADARQAMTLIRRHASPCDGGLKVSVCTAVTAINCFCPHAIHPPVLISSYTEYCVSGMYCHMTLILVRLQVSNVLSAQTFCKNF